MRKPKEDFMSKAENKQPGESAKAVQEIIDVLEELKKLRVLATGQQVIIDKMQKEYLELEPYRDLKNLLGRYQELRKKAHEKFAENAIGTFDWSGYGLPAISFLREWQKDTPAELERLALFLERCSGAIRDCLSAREEIDGVQNKLKAMGVDVKHLAV